MLKSFFLFLFLLVSWAGFSQSLAGLNYRYLYDPQNEVDLSMKLVNEKDQLTLFYRLLQNGTEASGNCTITWRKYESYTDKEGTVLSVGDSAASSGKISFPAPEKPWVLAAKVTNKSSSRSWTYTQSMDSKFPVNGFLEGKEGILFKPYVVIGQEYTVHAAGTGQPLRIYYYKPDFPVASPPFLEKGIHVDRFLFADSSFTVIPGQKMVVRSKGLYLVQADTMATEGFAFMAMNASYPKLTKIEDIPDPLIFVCAKEEHDELVAAGSDKSKVDKVILDITRDTDRAKTFMRSYFRKVELANMYFSAYKEGWKSDRGMIYLIFGLPDEVSRTGLSEVWYYKNFRERFTFVKNGSVYDPNNYILQRSSKFAELWFNTVDLWRKSRF